MERCVILVVDMLNGFLCEGFPLYCGAKARAIIPNVVATLDNNPRFPRVFVCDSHKPDDLEFKMFPPHCIEGTEEAELIGELQGYSGPRVKKRRFSGFFGTCLEEMLSKYGFTTVILMGVCTDICILFTAVDLRNRDYEVIIPVNCVASFDEDAHEFALCHMQKVLGVNLLKF